MSLRVDTVGAGPTGGALAALTCRLFCTVHCALLCCAVLACSNAGQVRMKDSHVRDSRVTS